MLESGRYIIAGAIALVVGFATLNAILTTSEFSPLPPFANNTSDTHLSEATVAQHNRPGDCWTIIEGKVYDISKYINAHPGGPVITQACGTDGTYLFNTKGGTDKTHSTTAHDILSQFLIGNLGEQQDNTTTSLPSQQPNGTQNETKQETTVTQLCVKDTEAAKHNKQSDCIIRIGNTYYDVTTYIPIHPGGKAQILPYCGGGDATQAFATKGGTGGTHSSFATNTLASLAIGTACAPTAQTANTTALLTATITKPLNLQQLTSGTTQTTIQVTTSTQATCKYSTNDQTYASMATTFSGFGTTKHTATITGLVDGQSYTRYVRCADAQGKPMTYSATVTWSIGVALPLTTTLDLATVAQHDSQSSCWLVINGKVYDVTAFLPVHPGGLSVILPFCGAADATNAFETKDGQGTHSNLAQQLLASYLLGTLGAAQPVNQTNQTNQTTPLTLLVAAPSTSHVFPAGTASVTLSLITNRAAVCKYATTNQAYTSMSSTFTTTGATTHSTSLATADGNSYVYYVRCQDLTGIEGTSSVTFSTQSPPSAQTWTYTLADVALHNIQSDCWIIVSNKVYGVTAYIPIHPGGVSRIRNVCGTDATTPFNTKGGQGSHSNTARNLLAGYYLGDLVTSGGTGGNNTTGGGTGGTGGSGSLNLTGTTGVPAMDQSIAAAYPGATITSANIEDDGRGEIKIRTASGQSITVKLNSAGQITGTG